MNGFAVFMINISSKGPFTLRASVKCYIRDNGAFTLTVTDSLTELFTRPRS